MFPSRVAIVGLGLIGGSLARSLKKVNPSLFITGVDTNDLSIRQALAAHVIDASATLEAAAENAELIIFATPARTTVTLIDSLAPYVKQGCIITDTASVKLPIVRAMEKLPDRIIGVPAHPIAGAERSGFQAAHANLFEHCRVLLCPSLGQEKHPAVQTVAALWQKLGSVVDYMPADMHDMVYAYISHLPHLCAYAEVQSLAPYVPHAHPYSSFMAHVRIAGSDPVLWRDVLLANRDSIVPAVDMYLALLGHLRGELVQGAEEKRIETVDDELLSLFSRLCASCLVSVVQIAEEQQGMKLARYAGTGFADYAAPALKAPDMDIEAISGRAGEIAYMLKGYGNCLYGMRDLIARNDPALLEQCLRHSQEIFLHWNK